MFRFLASLFNRKPASVSKERITRAAFGSVDRKAFDRWNSPNYYR